MGGRSIYRYSVFGLGLESEIPFPEFVLRHGPCDANIRFGSVPEHLPGGAAFGVGHESGPNRILLKLPGTARFLVEAGRDITVEPQRHDSDQLVRVFLATTALGALLIQRGVFVLHAAACVTDRGAILLAGYSGRGKSTTLAALVAKGLPMLTDDVAAITRDPRGPIVHPAFPLIKLWSDSVEAMHLGDRDLPRVRPRVDKYLLPATTAFVVEPHPVVGVFILEYGAVAGVEVTRLVGAQRLAAIRAQAYCRPVAADRRLQVTQFRIAADVAAKAEVFTIRRPRGLELVADVADVIAKYVS